MSTTCPRNAKGSTLGISPSAVSTFHDCNMAWYLGYVLFIRDRGTVKSRLGVEMHDMVDQYLRTGEPPANPRGERWRRIMPGLEYLPATLVPGRLDDCGWSSEEKVVADAGALPFRGQVDFHNAPGLVRGDFESLVVADWKTTGGGRQHIWQYAQSPESLRALGQPLAYSYALAAQYGLPREGALDFQHIYLASRGRAQATTVWACNVPWSEVEDYWQHTVVPTASRMAALASGVAFPTDYQLPVDAPRSERYAPWDPAQRDDLLDRTNLLDVPYAEDTATCGKYGGCSFRSICPFSPENRRRTLAPATPTPTGESNHMANQNQINAARAKLGLPPLSGTSPAPAPVVSPPSAASSAPPPRASLASIATRIREMGHPLPVDAVRAMVSGAGHSWDDTVHAALASEGLSVQGSMVRATPAPATPAEPEPEPAEVDLVGMTAAQATDLLKARLGKRRLSRAGLMRHLRDLGMALQDGKVARVSDEPAPAPASPPAPAPVASPAPASRPLVLVNAVIPGEATAKLSTLLAPFVAAVEAKADLPWLLIPYADGPKGVAALVKDRGLSLPPVVYVDIPLSAFDYIAPMLGDVLIVRGVS